MSVADIIPFSPELKPYFESINKAWVSRYFSLEAFDIEQLERPEETILAKGGAILFAKFGNETAGTVALIPIDETSCEMIKMGVDDRFQGMGVGYLLGNAILQKAKEMGFGKMILYSNTKLTAALRLYQKLGFESVPVPCGAYSRCDVKMEKSLLTLA